MARIFKSPYKTELATCIKCGTIVEYEEFDKTYKIIEDDGDSIEIQRIICPACKKVIPIKVRIMTEDW